MPPYLPPHLVGREISVSPPALPPSPEDVPKSVPIVVKKEPNQEWDKATLKESMVDSGNFEFKVPKMEFSEFYFPYPCGGLSSTRTMTRRIENPKPWPMPSRMEARTAPAPPPVTTTPSPPVPLLIPKVEPPDRESVPLDYDKDGGIQDIYVPPIEDPETFMKIFRAVSARAGQDPYFSTQNPPM